MKYIRNSINVTFSLGLSPSPITAVRNSRNGVGSGLSFSELLPVGQFDLGWKFLRLKNQYFTWGSARRRVGHSEPHRLSTALQLVLVSSNFMSLKVLGD